MLRLITILTGLLLLTHLSSDGMLLTSALQAQGLDTASQNLDIILKNRPEEQKKRDIYRHPKEVMTLVGIKEGMTVIDALPGSWYGNVIMPLLGENGHYIGTSYSAEHAKVQYGDNQARIESALAFPESFKESAKSFGPEENRPQVSAYLMNDFPDELVGTVDVYMFLRALHHLNRLETRFLDEAAAEAFTLLKPDGIVGIVQHRASEDMPDEWANGSKGYLKQSRVIAAFKAAGFVLETASEINANKKDQPTISDIVWRLPPAGGRDEKTRTIGESDRMTLVFRKPA